MERGKLEEDLSRKFSGASAKAPSQVWGNIEAELDKGLVATYAATNRRYKWAAVAAILVASLSFAYQFMGDSSALAEYETGQNYNALLSRDYSSNAINRPTWSVGSPTFLPVIIEKEVERPATLIDIVETTETESAQQAEPEFHALASMSYIVPEVKMDAEVSRYLQAPSYRQLSKNGKKESNALWAGLEAGAGNFNSASPNSLSSGVDPVNLASAIGNDGFINPSTVVNSDLDNGIATSLGIDFGVNLGSKWTLETGVAYTNVSSNGNADINVLDTYIIGSSRTLPLEGGNAILASSSRETDVVVEENYDHSVEVSSSTQFTSVPLMAGYFLVDDRMSLRLNVGFAANYLVTSQISGEGGVINGSLEESFNTWSFDGLGGVEIGYAVSDNFDLVLEPNYRRAITPMNIGSNASASRFIIQTGLKYTLQ